MQDDIKELSDKIEQVHKDLSECIDELSSHCAEEMGNTQAWLQNIEAKLNEFVDRVYVEAQLDQVDTYSQFANRE